MSEVADACLRGGGVRSVPSVADDVQTQDVVRVVGLSRVEAKEVEDREAVGLEVVQDGWLEVSPVCGLLHLMDVRPSSGLYISARSGYDEQIERRGCPTPQSGWSTSQGARNGAPRAQSIPMSCGYRGFEPRRCRSQGLL